jgi:D-alanyl-D-alanine carboxypeptidase
MMVLLLVAAALAVPRPLACLEKYYGVQARCDERGCVARLPDGTELAYDDGKQKSPEERLEHPDIKDVFATRYRAGAIREITSSDEDPGRARLDALFAAIYPKSGLVEIELFGKKHRVHKRVAEAFRRVAARLIKVRQNDAAATPFLEGLGGTYAPRNIAGTDRPSAHSWGISLDLNPKLTQYWRWEKSGWHNKVPQSIVDAFEAEGFIWGGRWFHYDTMHFEYRPELLDGSCYE